MHELEAEDHDAFTNFLRVPLDMYRDLGERLTPRLLTSGPARIVVRLLGGGRSVPDAVCRLCVLFCSCFFFFFLEVTSTFFLCLHTCKSDLKKVGF